MPIKHVEKFVGCGNKLMNICMIIYNTYYIGWINYFTILNALPVVSGE